MIFSHNKYIIKADIFYRNFRTAYNILLKFKEFFFDNVLVEDLSEKCLAITAYHQSPQKLQKDVIIGDLYVSLKNLSELRSKKELRIIEELKYHVSSKVNYYIIFQFSLL